MKIAFITSLGHNPGDDFIRFGQEYLLQQVDPHANFTYIHKHDPRTMFESFEPRRSPPHRLVAPWLFRIEAMRNRQPSKLDKADLVVFAGTPFIFRQNTWLFPATSANVEWIGATWHRLFRELTEIPVLNLAAGTSLPTRAHLDRLLADRKIVQFLTFALERATLTTARDHHTADILRRLGHAVPLLPCTSLWAARRAGIKPPQQPQYVAINVMPHAVHKARGLAGSPDRWKKMIEVIVRAVARRHAVCFVCHAQDEADTAARWFPNTPIVFSKDPLVLIRAYAAARYGICNRVHGAAALASAGRPAVAIGGDTRVDLIRQFRLPTFDYREITSQRIVEACEMIENTYERQVASLKSLAEQAEKTYLDLIRTAIACRAAH